MSTTIVAVGIQLASTLLPLIGINVGSEALTTTVQTVLLVATGLWIWVRRIRVGDVNTFGIRKQ